MNHEHSAKGIHFSFTGLRFLGGGIAKAVEEAHIPYTSSEVEIPGQTSGLLYRHTTVEGISSKEQIDAIRTRLSPYIRAQHIRDETTAADELPLLDPGGTDINPGRVVPDFDISEFQDESTYPFIKPYIFSKS
ncbi:MAG TPA: hypothetical protein VG935_03475 [Patescibacteria group bacterium]|nr:hypothetical protein [Patescibacteria group bacterium]